MTFVVTEKGVTASSIEFAGAIHHVMARGARRSCKTALKNSSGPVTSKRADAFKVDFTMGHEATGHLSKSQNGLTTRSRPLISNPS